MVSRGLALLLTLALAPGALAGPPPDGGGARVKQPVRTVAQVKLLYFRASWCASCRKLDEARVVDRLVEREPGLAVERVDVDANEALLDKYGVEFTPTLVLVDASGFPLGKPKLEVDAPDATLERVHALVRKMTGR